MSAPRIKSYDGLKGFSILMVIFYHLFPQYIPGGFMMVNAFLVLAGFFFAHKMERIFHNSKIRTKQSIKKYLMTTTERVILPLWWMLMMIVIGYMLVQPQELHYIRDELISSTFLVNNWYQILADRSYFVKMTSATPFTHLWYNAIYIQSFLLSIPLFWLTCKFKLSVPAKGIFWSIIVAISHGLMFVFYQADQDPSRVYYGLDIRYSSFALGLVTAYSLPIFLNATHKLKHKRTLYKILGLFVTLIPLITVALIKDDQAITYYLWMATFNMICMVLIWLIAINPPLVRNFWGNPIFHFLGQRSYAYYLWYFPVIIFCMGLFRTLDGNMILIHSLSLLGILIIGEIFHQIVEKAKIFIPFGNRLRPFPVREENAWLKPKERIGRPNRVLQVVFFMAMAAFIYGLFTSRNDKRVALMELEYQTYRFAPNLLDEPFPAERGIIETKDNVQQLDQLANTALTRAYTFDDPVETMLDDYKTAKDNERIISQMVNMKVDEIKAHLEQLKENNKQRKEIAQQHPIVVDNLSPEEFLFASQVPMTLFGDSIVNINGVNTLEIFKNGNYYGQGSLQIWDAIPIYEQMLQDGDVQENVVINLGTNASLDRESLDDMVRLSGDRQVFFINTNSRVQHIEEVNDHLDEVAKAYDNVHVVDWHAYQKGHPEWYAADEIHHSVEGMEYFTVNIAQTMYQVLVEDK